VIRLMENEGWSWGMVAEALGISRTAVKKRFGGIVKSTRRPGAQPARSR
jgi:biotin operon repressor